MNYTDINPGDTVIVTTRRDKRAIVVDKFRSQESSPTDPAGTEFVQLRWPDNKGGAFFNYPHQLAAADA